MTDNLISFAELDMVSSKRHLCMFMQNQMQRSQ